MVHPILSTAFCLQSATIVSCRSVTSAVLSSQFDTLLIHEPQRYQELCPKLIVYTEMKENNLETTHPGSLVCQQAACVLAL